MARTKAKPTITINDLQEANNILGEIAAIKRDLTFIETDLNKDIDALKAHAAAKSIPLKNKVKELEAALLAYATYNKTELFPKRRSVELLHGILSFRRSKEIQAVKPLNLEKVLIKCKALGFKDAVRVKEELNKEELQTWTDEKLDLVGAKRVEKDVFGYELKQEELAEAA